MRDLSFAIRLLRRQSLVTAAAVLTVALGVGANTAIVSVLETVLLNPLGLDAGRVMVATTRWDALQMTQAPTSGVEYRELQTLTGAFSAAAATERRAWTAEIGGGPVRLLGQAVTRAFFRLCYLAATLSPCIGALIGVGALLLSGGVAEADFWQASARWWMG